MRSYFRIFSFTLIATLLSIMVACQNSKEEATKNSDGTGSMTLTVFDSDTNHNWESMESPVGEKIKEDTGVILDPEFDTEGGKTKIPLMVASGEYPDMILPKSEASTLVDAGALIDLAPLIEEYAPNIKKMLSDDLDRLKWSKDDPSIYILSNNTVDEDRAHPNFGALVQHDVVRELEYPEMKTLEDLENAIRKYKKLHPEINGQPTIGLTMPSDGWRLQSATLNSGFMMTGGSDDGEYFVDPETFEATLHYRRPEEKEVFRWYNQMNDEGLLDPESFVQKHDQLLAKLSTGRALATIAPDWMVYEAQSALRDAGMEERMYGMYPITLSEEYEHHAFRDSGFQVGWGIGITTDCKDPVRAIKFLDYLVKEETQIMLNWGIEGEHYEVADGKRVIPESILERRNNDKNFPKETGIGYNFSRFAPRYGDGAKDSTGQTYTINSREQQIANQTEIEKETLKNYGVELWKDLYPSKDEFPVSPWGAAYNLAIPAGSKLEVNNQKMLDITSKRVLEAILSEPEEFDGIWDKFMKDLEKTGVEKSEEEFTQIIKDTVELWND